MDEVSDLAWCQGADRGLQETGGEHAHIDKTAVGCKSLNFFNFLISPLFNQVGQLKTSSHLQLRPGQYQAKQCDTNNNTELHME